jgi:hypothetical protein
MFCEVYRTVKCVPRVYGSMTYHYKNIGTALEYQLNFG